MRQRRYSASEHAPDRQPDCSPELELLLLCARWPQRERVDCERIRALATSGIDWQHFLRLVQHHRLVPLVAHNLHASEIESGSPECRSALGELQRLWSDSAHESLRCLAELRRVVEELQSRNVSVRVLKGLPLAQSVFGDLNLRAPGDIDLLIGESDIVEADRVLRSFGYCGQFRVERFSIKRLRFYRAHWKEIVYRNQATGMEIDLHWRCFRNSAMPGNGLCAASGKESAAFGGFRVDTLPRLEGLLYLCVHGTLDGWLYLKSLADVAAQVRGMTEAELDSLATLAASYGILPELSATLILVRRYLALDAWSARLLEPSDSTVAHILRYSDRVLVEGEFLADRESIPLLATMAFDWGLRRNFRYRFEMLIRVLFRPRMWETIPLPDFLFGLYPLLSPIEWAIFRVRKRWGKCGSRGARTV